MDMKTEIRDDHFFYINDKPIKIISGAIHYNRIVPEYWEDRLLKIKYMGCNTIETYVPWNLHEPEGNVYTFEGQANLMRFLDLCHKLDLFVILRPSPYVCGEWEFGGLPYWLLKDQAMRVRTLYQPFIDRVEAYFKILFDRVRSYQINYGGPIILMQVENEYGYFSNEKNYLRKLIKMMKSNGVVVPIVTSDSTRPTMLKAGSLPEEAHPTVNCGANLKERIPHLAHYLPNGPWMTMEFWIGWFDVWGKPGEERDITPILKDYNDMLEMGHINMYMAHGGTNFGFMNGANYYEEIEGNQFREVYRAATTSYDYGAPISEDGQLKPSYYQFKECIEKHTGKSLPLPDELREVHIEAYGSFALKNKVSLFETLDTLSNPVYSDYPLTMEQLNQAYGYVLYQSTLGPVDFEQRIKLLDTSDRAQVYMNKHHVWTAFGEEFQTVKTITCDSQTENELSILVENMGRVNFGPYLNDQRKGINRGVMLDEYQHTGWEHYSLPLNNIEAIDFSKNHNEGQPGFYQFDIEIMTPHDTYLDFSGWGKGVAILNNFNLGRFFEAGPQTALYVPKHILNEGINKLVVFETEGKYQETIVSINGEK